MSTTTASFTVRSTDPDRRSITGDADDIHSALDAAWALNRHTEDDVEILDNRDETPRVIATLSLTWADE